MFKRLLLFLFLFTAHAYSQYTISLAWDAVADPDLAGYKMYYGVASTIYTTTLDVGKTLTVSIPFTTPNHYYFAATAYDANGNESAFSNEVDTLLIALQFSNVTFANGKIACSWVGNALAYNLICYVAGKTESLPVFDLSAAIKIPYLADWSTAAITIQALNLANQVIATDTRAVNVPASFDIDFDGKIWLSDLQAFANTFGCRDVDPCYDFRFDANRDGIVYNYDLNIFASLYGCQALTPTRLGTLNITLEQLKGMK